MYRSNFFALPPHTSLALRFRRVPTLNQSTFLNSHCTPTALKQHKSLHSSNSTLLHINFTQFVLHSCFTHVHINRTSFHHPNRSSPALILHSYNTQSAHHFHIILTRSFLYSYFTQTAHQTHSFSQYFYARPATQNWHLIRKLKAIIPKF